MRNQTPLLLALLLASCGPSGGNGGNPPPPPPPAYTKTLLGTVPPAGVNCTLGSSTDQVGTYDLFPAQFIPDGQGGALLGQICIVNGEYKLTGVYRANAAGVKPAATVPENVRYFNLTPSGLAYHQLEGDQRSIRYLTPDGQAYQVPYGYDPDIVNGFYSNDSGIEHVEADGTVYGWHRVIKLGNDGMTPDRQWAAYIWTWKPGQGKRQVLGIPFPGNASLAAFMKIRPGNPATGEQIAFAQDYNGNRLQGWLRQANGYIYQNPALQSYHYPNYLAWTPQGYVVTYSQNVNGAEISYHYLLVKDGVITEQTGTVLSVAPDGDLVVELWGGQMVLRRANGQEFELPLKANSDINSFLAAGNGMVYYTINGSVYRLAPTSLTPSGTLTLSAVTPADAITAESINGAAAQASRSADGKRLSISIDPPDTTGTPTHNRLLLIDVKNPDGSLLASGQTLTVNGPSGAVGTGVTYTDITTNPIKVNALLGKSGTITLDAWTGSSAKVTLKDVLVQGNAGQNVTLNGTLTLPEIPSE